MRLLEKARQWLSEVRAVWHDGRADTGKTSVRNALVRSLHASSAAILRRHWLTGSRPPPQICVRRSVHTGLMVTWT
jgi:hypothetical protein